jgi:hypothetical protein
MMMFRFILLTSFIKCIILVVDSRTQSIFTACKIQFAVPS